MLIHTRDYSQILKIPCTQAGGQTDGKLSNITLLNTIISFILIHTGEKFTYIKISMYTSWRSD
jgi:hypothetical protein